MPIDISLCAVSFMVARSHLYLTSRSASILLQAHSPFAASTRSGTSKGEDAH